MIKYALITKENPPSIVVWRNTVDKLDVAIKKLYWLRKGTQPKGSDYTLEDFLSQYHKVKIEISLLEEEK